MKTKYLRTLFVWLGLGIIFTTYLYMQPEHISGTSWGKDGPNNYNYFEENHFEISAAITIGVSLFIIAVGLKRKDKK